MKRIGSFLLMLVISVVPLPAGEILPLTPEKSVEYALEGNLTLANKAINLRQKEREYKNGWNNFLPVINGSGSLAFSDRLFSADSPASAAASAGPWNLRFGVNISLPLNWSAAPGLESLRLQYEAGKISYEQARAGIRRDVLKNYYGLLTQEANLRILRENADLADTNLKTVQTKFDRGLLPETDLLKARVNAGHLRNSYLNANSSHENALMGFLILLGLPSDTGVQLTGTLEPPASIVAGDKALAMISETSELQEILLTIRILEKAKEAIWYGHLTPSLSLGIGWQGSVPAPFEAASWESGSWQDALSLTMTLSIPLDGLMPGSAWNTAIDAAGDTIDVSRNNYRLAAESKQTRVRGLLKSIENAERSSAVSLENRKLAQRNLDLTQEAWRSGTRSLLEVETSQAELLSAGQDYLLSLYSWIGYLLDLEYELGGPAATLGSRR
jgi:outer membrane protein TolC